MELYDKYGEMEMIVAGDYNINFLIASGELQMLENLMESYGLFKSFNQPSRIGKTSSTCIDNIFTQIEKKHNKLRSRKRPSV